MNLKNIFKRIDKIFFPNFYNGYDEYRKILEKECTTDNIESLLDIGCGGYSPIASFANKIKYTVGCDSFGPSIEFSRSKKVHSEEILMDILDIGRKFEPKSFDCVIALDLIEHIEKNKGEELIEDMEKLAKKKVIIFTPNGFVPQGVYDGNIHQIHKSGWSYSEMTAKGYKAYGLNGWKVLRGEYAKVNFKPAFFWDRISYITQFFTRIFPRFSYQIIWVKTIN